MDRVTIVQWNDRLKDKVDGYRSVDEAMFARACYDQGLSVNKAEDALNAKRKGLVH